VLSSQHRLENLVTNMTLQQFLMMGEEVGREAGVLDGLQGYFRQHAKRLHQCCAFFDLFSRQLGDVLEIGPFYGYTPFALRGNSASYTVLEGDDPAAYPLKQPYEKRSIKVSYIDLFELFGPTRSAPHALALADSSFDTILCWETMEHFNFNPVKFVRELHRALKPGGRVCITVPNKASFQALVVLLFGRGEKSLIDSYYQFENYESNGKKAFYGFHWREYSPPELTMLFARAGFRVSACGSLTTFQGGNKPGLGRQMARMLSRAGAKLLPRYGTHTFLVATKI
jgi:SAM-dependent methyltransferase